MNFTRLSSSACLAAVFAFGCDMPAPKKIPATVTVTFHIPDMCERLELL